MPLSGLPPRVHSADPAPDCRSRNLRSTFDRLGGLSQRSLPCQLRHTIQQLLREAYGLRVATGTLAKLCQKVSRSLEASYADLRRQIPEQASLHIDETSHRESGQWQWTWVFRARQFTLFHIDPTRSADVLEQVLGSEFSGTLLADYYAAYRAYLASHPRTDAQFCLAHLVRDVKFLETLPEEADRQFAAELLAELKALFRLWHASGDYPDEATFRAALIAQGQQLQPVTTEQAPDTKASQRLARRFQKHGDQYLRFTHVRGLEPANNAAERAIRQVVIDRRVTQRTLPRLALVPGAILPGPADRYPAPLAAPRPREPLTRNHPRPECWREWLLFLHAADCEATQDVHLLVVLNGERDHFRDVGR